jgi:hypothetical protein
VLSQTGEYALLIINTEWTAEIFHSFVELGGEEGSI